MTIAYTDSMNTKSEREHWLNGWHRNSNAVLVNGDNCCAGCGKSHGVIGFISTTEGQPSETPQWPFDEETCPLCCEETKTTDEKERDKLIAIARCIEKHKGASSVAVAREIVLALKSPAFAAEPQIATEECHCGCHHPTADHVEMHFRPCCEGKCNKCGKWFVAGLAFHQSSCGIVVHSAGTNDITGPGFL